MSEARLAPAVEVAALLRLATAQGGFGAVLHKGDPERGAVQLLLAERGTPVSVGERLLGAGGRYHWQVRRFGDAAQLQQHLARARAADPDLWVVELDVPSAERFIAEMSGPY